MAGTGDPSVDKLLETLLGLTDSVDDLIKYNEKYLKSLEKSQGPFKNLESWKGMLTGTKASFLDLTDKIDEAGEEIEKLTALIESNAAGVDKAAAMDQRSKMQDQRATLLMTQAKATAIVGIRNFAIGVGGATSILVRGATDFVKGLQDGKEGTELAGDAALKAAEATGKMAEEMGSVVSVLGLLMTMLPVGKLAKFAGGIVAFAGAVAEVAGPAMSEAAKEGLQILNKEVEKTKKTFRSLSESGVIFGNGMTEIRQQAVEAGYDVEQFANIVKNNTQGLNEMGFGIVESTRRFVKMSKDLRNSGLSDQLYSLGLTYEQHGEAIISATTILNTTGKLRSMSDRDVSKYTVEYTKNLKLLQQATGADVKAKTAEANKKALEADLFAQARKTGEEGVARLQGLLTVLETSGLDEKAKTGILELMASKGEFTTSGELVSAMNLNEELRNFANYMATAMHEETKTREDVIEGGLVQLKKVGDNALSTVESSADIALAARAAKSQMTTGITDIVNSTTEIGVRMRNMDIAAMKEELLKGASGKGDELGKSIGALDRNAQDLRVALTDSLTPLITSYTNTLNEGFNLAEKLNDVLRKAIEGIDSTSNQPGIDDENKGMLGSAAVTGLLGAGAIAGALKGFSMGTGVMGSAASAAGGAAVGAGGLLAAGAGGYGAGMLINKLWESVGDKNSIGSDLYDLFNEDPLATPTPKPSQSTAPAAQTSAVTQSLDRIAVAMEKNNRLTSTLVRQTG